MRIPRTQIVNHPDQRRDHEKKPQDQKDRTVEEIAQGIHKGSLLMTSAYGRACVLFTSPTNTLGEPLNHLRAGRFRGFHLLSHAYASRLAILLYVAIAHSSPSDAAIAKKTGRGRKAKPDARIPGVLLLEIQRRRTRRQDAFVDVIALALG